jgi:hypothetical protein
MGRAPDLALQEVGEGGAVVASAMSRWGKGPAVVTGAMRRSRRNLRWSPDPDGGGRHGGPLAPHSRCGLAVR